MSQDARPNAVSSIYAEEIISGFDLYKPEKLNTLFERYGDQGLSMLQVLRTLGFENPVSQDTYSHFEANRIHENFIALSSASGAAGATVDITLSPEDLDGNNRFYPRQFDIVMLKNEVTGIIMEIDSTTPAAPVLTVLPNVATDAISVLAGETVIIISAAFSEGSGQPKGAVRGVVEIFNDAQIIKETVSATGSEMVRQTWTSVTDMGNNIPAYYMLGTQLDIDYRLSLKIDGAILFGKRTTNNAAVDPATGRRIKTTQGAVNAIRTRGHDFPVADGDLDVPLFDQIDRILDQEGCSKYVMTMLGIKRHQEIENVLYEYLQNTEESFATDQMATDLFGGGLDGKSKAVSVNFQSLFKSERKFLFKRMNNFNNAKTYGSDGYGMPTYGIFMPLGKSKDPRTGKPLESVGIRYRQLGAYNRRMEVWTVGGAGEGLKVTEFDKRDWFQRVHVGAHHNKVNQMLLLNDIIPAS
jgi:hypothetical protein